MSTTADNAIAMLRPLTAALTLAEAGGKGANLSVMARSRLPTSPGFVIAADAYRRFVHENRLDALTAARWQALDSADAADFEQAASSLRAAHISSQYRRCG
jgi:pyruvate,water dikinase